MSRLSRFTYRHRRLVLLVTVLALPFAAVAGAGVHDQLSTGGFISPSAPSTQAGRELERLFKAGPSNFILLANVHSGTVGDPDNSAAGRRLTTELAAEPGVADVLSYWNIPVDPPERSPLADFPEKQAVVAARLVGNEGAQRHAAERFAPKYNRSDSHFTITTGGSAEVSRQAATEAERSLKRSEMLTAPLILAGLLIVFGGVLAATIPLGVAGLAVVGTFVALSALASLTDVSILALNLTTALGLGLAVDYSLLLVSRYREELAAQHTVEAAIARTLETAGRTVVFSGATVAASLAALLVFPIPYLRSFAYAGIAVVLLSCFAALIVLPAVLGSLGDRLHTRRAQRHGAGFWGRQASRVMRHALLYVTGATALLLLLGLPFLGAHMGRIDDRVLPAHLSSRQTNDAIRKAFDFEETTPIAIVLAHTAPNDAKGLSRYVGAILKLDNIHRVDWAMASSTTSFSVGATSYHRRFVGSGATWLSVVPSLPFDSSATKQLVRQLRAIPGPGAIDRWSAAPPPR
jgi:RND superfamily putative drug exporter